MCITFDTHKGLQMYSENNLDARTFPEIWETLTLAEQEELRDRLTRYGDCTRMTLFNWTKGVRPISLAMRRKVAAAMNKYLGLNVSHITLFPGR